MFEGLAQIVINAGFIAGFFTTSLALTPARVDGWGLALHGIPLLTAPGSA